MQPAARLYRPHIDALRARYDAALDATGFDAVLIGAGTFRQGGREPPETPGKLTEEQYNKLSIPDRIAYARQQTAAMAGKKVA